MTRARIVQALLVLGWVAMGAICFTAAVIAAALEGVR